MNANLNVFESHGANDDEPHDSSKRPATEISKTSEATEKKEVQEDLPAEQPAERKIHDNCVPMKDVLAGLDKGGVFKFFAKARSQAAVPQKTFEELVEVVESVGLTQAQCIHVDAKKWLIPAGGTTGTNRHSIAGVVLRHIIKHFACSKRGETHGHLTAARLTSVDLDHHEAKKHTPAQCSRMRILDAIRENAK